MKAIKCPNCGSEQVKELTEEKYACMACDNVFLIHNHSKEFRKTDEHISSMHQDLKDDISKIINSSNIDPDAIIEKAEQHLKKKDWDIASDLYDKASEENPDKLSNSTCRSRSYAFAFEIEFKIYGECVVTIN